MIGMTSDPMVSQQWQYNNTGQAGGTPGADIDAFEAWDITTGSASIAVAILDTGIDKTHVDLASKVTKRVNFSTSTSDDDQVGHGTHVAGTVAAITNNAPASPAPARSARCTASRCWTTAATGPSPT